jgi:cellobiose phosphorylase
LNESVSYYEKDAWGAPVESGTVCDHLARALRFTKENTGNHGLPLLGFADWNDCVNLPTGAESIFNTCLYSRALLEMVDIETFLGHKDKAEAYRTDHAVMKKHLNERAWDGDWYVSYYNADGSPLGSNSNSDGKIYLYTQAWPVLAELATEEHGRTALNSARKMLNTKKGLKLSTPGFNGYDQSKGGITTYPPGAKENGGIFLHTNPWMMIAEAVMGDGNRAYEYYNQINPATKNDIIDEYECEPYVYPQNILGDEHPLFGLARNSWLSGTSSWTYQAASRYIMGIRPQMDGLLVDPCVPSDWKRFSVERNFRGCRYVINVENPGRVCKGVKSISVDGKALDKPVVPAFTDGKTHEVNVVMG